MRPGVNNAFLIAAILFVMPSCEEVNNPFDPECPKDVWTPENLVVEQVGDALKLNWDQPMNNISGFRIERKLEGGEWSAQTTLGKAARVWTDNNVLGGKLHTYQIYAYAGDNSSNKVTANYTPLIKATAIASEVTEYGDDWAKLEGEVNPNGLETSVSFQYKIISDNQWNNVKATPETLTGSSAIKVNAEIHDLTPGKEYQFKVIASNDAGISESDNLIAFSTAQGVLNLSSQNINVNDKAGTIEVSVTTNLENLDITDNVSWLDATISGTTIQITYDANDNVESREATITVTAGELSKSITVTQGGTSPSILVTPTSKSVQRPAGNTSFTVTSNISWSVEDDASWVAAVKTNNTTITVTYLENTSSNSRTASIRVYGSEGIEQIVTLIQTGINPELNVTPTSRSVGWQAGSTSFSVSSNVSWSVENNASWLTTDKTNNTTVSVAYSENTSSDSRTANIRVYSPEGAEQTVTLDQEGSETNGTFKDNRDGSIYKWVKIGDQIWMAENLDIGERINGTVESTNNQVIEKYYYNNDPSLGAIYGGLYQWDEMMGYTTMEGAQGVCPAGWHVPSNDEWKKLEMNLGMSQAEADATGMRGNDQGKQLKSGGTSGFEALMGGKRTENGTFESLYNYTTFWTSSLYNRTLSTQFDQVWSSQSDRPANGFSVRCIKD